MSITIRPASLSDIPSILNIIHSIVDEKEFTVLRKFTLEEEYAYFNQLNERETIFVAETEGKVVAFLSIDLPFKTFSEAMGHVGMTGTFVLKEFRGRGIGTLLSKKSLKFAKKHGYEKLVVYVMEDNPRSIKFHEDLGFKRVGLWTNQVKIDGKYHNEIIMELFL